MKLKRVIDQKETEPKVAWDSTCGWKSGPRRSVYASMLIVRKGKQWSIFLDAPLHHSPSPHLVHSEFSEKKDRRLSFSPWCYQQGNTSHQCGKTKRTNRKIKPLSAHPAGLLSKSILINVGQWLSFFWIVSLYSWFRYLQDKGWLISQPKESRAENSYLIFWPCFVVQDGIVW